MSSCSSIWGRGRRGKMVKVADLTPYCHQSDIPSNILYWNDCLLHFKKLTIYIYQSYCLYTMVNLTFSHNGVFVPLSLICYIKLELYLMSTGKNLQHEVNTTYIDISVEVWHCTVQPKQVLHFGHSYFQTSLCAEKGKFETLLTLANKKSILA